MSIFKTLKTAGAALALLAAAAAHAGPTLWVSTGNGQLATVDVSNGATTVVGNTSGIALTDIAFSPTGELYGISFTDLYKVNATTAALTLVGGLGSVFGTANALVFGADGTLYMAGSALYKVNTSTGAASAIGSGIGFSSGGDLAFVGGDLYMASNASDLIKINTSTGVGSKVGALGVANMFGLATPDNATLYGVAGQNVYTVNTSTGAATFSSTFAPNLGGGAFGLAFKSEAGGSVPEPVSLALVGAALLGAGAARRRIKRDC